MLEALKLPKLSKKIKFEGIWVELEAINISKHNHLQNILDYF